MAAAAAAAAADFAIEAREKGKPKTKTKPTPTTTTTTATTTTTTTTSQMAGAIATQVNLSEQSRPTWRRWAPKRWFRSEPTCASSVVVVEAEWRADLVGGENGQKRIITNTVRSSKPPLISIQLSGNSSGGGDTKAQAQAQIEAQTSGEQARPPPPAGHLGEPADLPLPATIGASAAAAAAAEQRQALAAANVDDVRRNFIALIRYNKLQYFYLGTLIYSVMNIAFLLYAYNLIAANEGQSADGARANKGDPAATTCAGDNFHWLSSSLSPLLLFSLRDQAQRYSMQVGLPVLVCLLALIAIVRALAFDKQLLPETNSSKLPDFTLASLLKPREGAEKALRASLKRKLAIILQSSGLVVVVLLLASPTVLLNSIDADVVISNGSTFARLDQDSIQLASNSEVNHQRQCHLRYLNESQVAANAGNKRQQQQQQQEQSSRLLPLLDLTQPGATTILALIYLLPLLLEGSSIIIKLIGALALLPALVMALLRFLWLSVGLSGQGITVSIGGQEGGGGGGGGGVAQFNETSHDNQTTRAATGGDTFNGSQRRLAANLDLSLVIVSLLPLALLFGLLKRRQYAHVISKNTFSGASQLIEAKVSLEHQRQQQETLLLSVLPAYVAEQVKRNMLKKMTSTTVHSSADAQEHAPASTCQQSSASRGFTLLTGGLFGNQQQQQHLDTVDESVGQVGTAATTTGSNELKPTSGNQDHQSSTFAPEVQQQQRLVGRSTSVASATSMRNSFLLSTRFTTSLVSGATFISGSLGATQSPTSRQPAGSIHQQSSYRLSNAPHHHHHQGSLPAQISGNTANTSVRRGFNELYIRTYNNVSLLYGDIVGFTRLCTQLSSSQLVRVLNDLFSHFDYLAEKHKIMRIKILGDCYYGVSGIPEFAVMGAKSRASRNDNHAINCVNMGLDMIHYIRCLNVERASSGSPTIQQALSHSVSASESPLTMPPVSRGSAGGGGGGELASSANLAESAVKSHSSGCKSAGNCTPMPVFELNMRVGVHTGHIHSGVIGLKKWQFDVWSNDVSIAMHCESSGKPGRVQVTEATVLQLNGAFTYENVPDNAQDSFLADKEISTYLICDRIKQPTAESSATLRAADQQHLSSEASVTGKKQQQQQQQLQQQQLAAKRKKQSVVQTVLEAANLDRIDREALIRGATDKKQQLAIDSNMDEDNIRAATIGTIRQTLLAGESANSSSALGFYGLIFNHHDMTPLLLNYRDPAMNKLYANRPINSLLFELSAIIIVLAFLLPLIDWQLLVKFYHNRIEGEEEVEEEGTGRLSSPPPAAFNATNQAAQVKFLLLNVLILIVLIIFSRWPLCCFNPNRGDNNEIPRNQVQNSTTATITTTTTTTKAHQVVLGDKSGCDGVRESSKLRKSVIDIYENVRATFMKRATKRTKSTDSKRQMKFKTGIAILLFSTVIIIQAYLIIFNQHIIDIDRYKTSCFNLTSEKSISNAQNGDRNNWFIENRLLNEQYQLTVILLIISLDLSANLLSFKTKSLLILGVICLQVLSIVWLKPSSSLFAPKADCQLSSSSSSSSSLSSSSSNSGGYVNEIKQSTTTTGDSDMNQQVLNWTSNALLFVLALWSLAFARQLEYTSRTNFLWRMRLNVDHEELEYISGINKVLLENILPSHVVQHYLTHPNGGQSNLSDQLPTLQTYMRMSFSNMRNLNSDELYHEQHDSVAVMFASIPHFYEFYDESDISKQGLGCIALLNEIICDFDKLLLKNKFSRIEKIKTIGSTYMAAAGLRPSHFSSVSRSSNASQANAPLSTTSSQWSLMKNRSTSNNSSTAGNSQAQIDANLVGQTSSYVSLGADFANTDDRRLLMSQQKLNLICMVQFATSLMTALNGINKQSFQVFKLRVGVNTGPVIAGVIGAQRPFYDIWGDCVNIASRMESLGEVGRIQVEEKTAKLLQESLCSETYSIVRRGPIDVKGKGGMVTYFVDKKVTSLGSNVISDSVFMEQPQQQQHHQQQQQQVASLNVCRATASGSNLPPLARVDAADGDKCNSAATNLAEVNLGRIK